jgi:CII-binding regulator of phage lambda lysogenization HflD
MNMPAPINHLDIAKSIPFITLGLAFLLNFGTVVWFAATMSTNMERLTDKVLTLERQFSQSDRAREDIQSRVVRIETQITNQTQILNEIKSAIQDLSRRSAQ